MGDYTVIAEVSNALAGLLRRQMVPEALMNEENIGVCSPEDRGDIMLGIYLYDIKPSEALRSSEMQTIDLHSQRYPSSYLELYYMITAYSNGDVKYRSLEEQRLLGRALQVFQDFAVISPGEISGAEGDGRPIELQQQALSLEDKMKIWCFPNKPYKTSLFFKAAPVELMSRKTKRTARVMDIELTLEKESK